MIKYGCILCFLLLIVLVISRVVMMKKLGLQAFVFGKTHRSDFFLPIGVLFVVYHLFANTFDWPGVNGSNIINIPYLEYAGLVSCILGVCLFLWGILSFGMSFRIGIDVEHPGGLVTTGAFGFSRNPLYVAFAMELIGFFLVFPNIVFLIALICGFGVFHRQVLREEKFLKMHYGKEYEEYCRKVHRYL